MRQYYELRQENVFDYLPLTFHIQKGLDDKLYKSFLKYYRQKEKEVLENDKLMEDARKVAQKIAAASLPIAMMTKETVNAAYETTLSQGLRFERRLFHAMFGTEDQKEGMAAFVDKRPAQFKNR